MKSTTLETVLLLIGILAPTAAFVVFWVGKILNLRKEIIELQMRQEFQDKTIKRLQEDMDKFERWYNHGQNN